LESDLNLFAKVVSIFARLPMGFSIVSDIPAALRDIAYRDGILTDVGTDDFNVWRFDFILCLLMILCFFINLRRLGGMGVVRFDR